MKHAIAIFMFHIFSIMVFASIYSMIWDEFTFISADKKLYPIGMIDFLFYSITIQSSVGLTDIVADTTMSKSISSIQQMCLLGTNAIALYLFVKK